MTFTFKTLAERLREMKEHESPSTNTVIQAIAELSDLLGKKLEDNPAPALDNIKIEKAFVKEFWNGKFVELHSGDYERIVEIILELQNGAESNKELI